MLEINNICKTYISKKSTTRALDNISLSIGAGMFGLLGPNGAGKSSLMRTIATLQRPDSGTVLLNGHNIADEPDYMRHRLGYLPQDYGVYPGVSAYDLLDYLAKLKGIYNFQDRHTQIEGLLHQVNLTKQKEQAVSQFSGGMKQRFGIAQALLGDPEIIVVDEPTAGLDPEERHRFHNLLVEISKNKIVLLSTHIVEDVRQLCSQMAILKEGRISKLGSPEHIISELDNKVWQVASSKESISEYETKYRVIRHHLSRGQLQLHVLSDHCPGDEFKPWQADLEDAYFAALNSHSDALDREGNHATPH